MKIIKAIRGAITSLRFNYLAVITVVMMMLIVLVVYWQDLLILANEALQSEAVGHIILIPILISYIIYRKKEPIKASFALEKVKGKIKPVSFSDIVGVAFCLSAFLLYWYGSYTFYALEYHIISLPIFVIGVTLILFNTKTLKILVFPILFLLFLIPPPSQITYTAGAIMGNFHTQSSYTLLKAFGLNVGLESSYGPPTIILNKPAESPISFAVDLPCSGIYSLIAFIMFAAFLSYIIRGSIIKKTTLFITGFLVLQALNIVRMSSIVLIANWLGEEIAMNIFHLVGGWILIFLGMLVLLLIAEKIWKMQIFTNPNKSALCSTCKESLEKKQEFCTSCGKFLKSSIKISKRFWIKIAALLISCYLVTLSLQAPVFALAQAPEALTIESPSSQEKSAEIFPNVTGYHPIRFVYRDIQYEKIAHQDASLTYVYLPTNISDPTVWVDVGVANSITNLHSWEVCLVTFQTARGYAPLVNVLQSKDIQIMQNPPIIASYFAFQYPTNYTQISLYWYQKALFKTGVTIEPRYTRISLIVLTKKPNDYPKLEQKLTSMGQSIAAYWQPLKIQSLISLSIPTMQALLGLTILFATIIQTTQFTREWRRKTTNLKIFEKLALPKEKLLYKTIRELSQKTKKTTTQNITSALEKATGKAVKLNELTDLLNNWEKHGLIKADIANTMDQPKLIWKL